MTNKLIVEIDKLFSKIDALTLQYVEKEGRRILRRHKTLKEFIMGMGCALFTNKVGEHVRLGCYADSKEFEEFMEEMNEKTKLFGTPMRFTSDGEIRYNW